MKTIPLLILSVSLATTAVGELHIPAFTAYLDPDVHGAQVSKEKGITGWKDDALTVSWYGEVKTAGKLTAAIALQEPKSGASKFSLTIGTQKHEATAKNGKASFGDYSIPQPGYVRFELRSLNGTREAGDIKELILEGAAVAGAHFNLDARRNAASVHLMYPTPKEAKVAMFYNEVTAVTDPVATYYMACGFTRGYFGMQVNSPTERRIIFSVWDAASGQSAKDRSTVSADNQTQLVAKGEGVEASVFGNEGTGGHSHLVYPWKTGQAQRFVVTAKLDGDHTIYSGYWFHPDAKRWMLIASFRAPKDGGLLRGLYSFSEDFDGANGHLQRKALYGPQWIVLQDGRWQELTTAKFSHDATGKVDRLDRFMGVEGRHFFLSQGGFVPGFTPFGQEFKRSASFTPPVVVLPSL